MTKPPPYELTEPDRQLLADCHQELTDCRDELNENGQYWRALSTLLTRLEALIERAGGSDAT